VFGNPAKGATFAHSSFLWWLVRNILRGNHDLTVSVFKVSLDLDVIAHVFVCCLVSSLFTDCLRWSKLLILFSNFFITVFDFATLLMLWWVLKNVSSADVRRRLLEVNTLIFALQDVPSRLEFWLQQNFAVLVPGRILLLVFVVLADRGRNRRGEETVPLLISLQVRLVDQLGSELLVIRLFQISVARGSVFV